MNRHTVIRLAALVLLLAVAQHATGAEKLELRGAWVHARRCADAPSANRMLDLAAKMNLNTLYVLVFHDRATAYYRSEMVPMNPRVADGFDPLGHIVAEGRKRGIEVHAWFVNGPRAKGSKIIAEHPDWLAVDLAGRKVDWFDLCNAGVRQWQARLMAEVAQRYAVRGVHFDYIRFNSSSVSASPAAVAAARTDGVDLSALFGERLPAFGAFHGNPLAEPTTAKVLAEFDDGVPAIAVNPLGDGRTVLFNWHAARDMPRAVHRAFREALSRLGVKGGQAVCVLDSDVNAKKYGRRGYAAAVEWLRAAGFGAKRVRDADLAKLPPKAAVVLPNFYLMTDEHAQALLRHVEAGGGAIFIDGPVYALRKSAAARKLLGFRRMGKYFVGERLLRAARGVDPKLQFVPAGGEEVSRDACRRAYRRWHRWRKDQITRLVAAVRKRVRGLRDDCQVTAAVFYTESSADAVSQDWPRWVREGLVDYAVAMSYVPTAEQLGKAFAWWKRFDPELRRTIPAVAVYKVPKKLPAAERAARIAEQIATCRREGARGVVLFHLLELRAETAGILGRTVFAGKARPYVPGK